MHIFLSNDDGIHVPNIQQLMATLRQMTVAQIMMPNYNRSDTSDPLMINPSLYIQEQSNGDIVILFGTFIDCVYIGINTDLNISVIYSTPTPVSPL
ncbi:MAG: broad specificity 5'(3')-nucleotidase and polyphosphatase [Sodalis sp. Psp]|nr:broad specificity 5'(3')-nucleotidase and polyphosphatase [Sodalis sp. Psp]MCR3756780.1 broad specificity 5'(3')-nucleotidase and polyphosphatase [Sodalis sp. Ppy]